jgi:hypothetical protein
VGCGAESNVVVESEPSPTFEVVQAQLALEFLVVALDPPPQLGQSYELLRRRIGRYVAQIELEPPFGPPFGVSRRQLRRRRGLFNSVLGVCSA